MENPKYVQPSSRTILPEDAIFSTHQLNDSRAEPTAGSRPASAVCETVRKGNATDAFPRNPTFSPVQAQPTPSIPRNSAPRARKTKTSADCTLAGRTLATCSECFERLEWQIQTHGISRQFCKIESLIETFGVFVHAIKNDGDECEGSARFLAVDERSGKQTLADTASLEGLLDAQPGQQAQR